MRSLFSSSICRTPATSSFVDYGELQGRQVGGWVNECAYVCRNRYIRALSCTRHTNLGRQWDVSLVDEGTVLGTNLVGHLLELGLMGGIISKRVRPDIRFCVQYVCEQ